MPDPEKNFKDKVRSLNDLEIKRLVRLVIDKSNDNSDQNEFDPDFLRVFRFWDDVSSPQQLYAKKSINVTMNFFHQKFAVDSLAEDSRFSRYVSGFFEINPRQVASLMKKISNILGTVEKKDEKWRADFFNSFPPASQDLNCLDGTLERLEIIERDLTGNDAVQPYLQAHFLAIANLTDFISADVAKGNQVHVPKYLEYSLEISDEKSIHPQSQITFAKSVVMHQRYGQLFKDFLLKKIDETVDERRGEISQAIAVVNDMMQDAPVERWFIEMNQALQPFNDQNINLFEEDEEGKYKIGDEVVNDLALNHPAVKFLSSAEVKKILINSVNAGQEQNPEVAEYAAKQRQVRDSLSGNPAAFFSYEGIEAWCGLLNSAMNYPSKMDDQIFALEHLWMAGQQLLPAPQFSFVTAIDEIKYDNPDFFESIKNSLGEVLPSSVKRIEEVEMEYEKLIMNRVFLDDKPTKNIWEFVCYGFPTSKIVAKVEELGRNNGNIGVNQQLQSEVTMYHFMCRQLMQRPDAIEVMQAIKSNIPEDVRKEQFVKFSLMAASAVGEVDKCEFLLDNFVCGDPKYFYGSIFFMNIAARNSVTLFEKTKDVLLNHPNFLQEKFGEFDALESAVMNGSAVFVNKYLKILKPTEGRCFHLSGESICQNQLKSFVEIINFSPRATLFRSSSSANTLFHYAAREGREAFIMELIDFIDEAQQGSGFDLRLRREYVNSKNTLGQTPIYLAAKEGHAAEALLLFSKLGANPFIEDKNGVNAAEIALRERKKNVVEAFVENRIYREIGSKGGGIIFELLKIGRSDDADFLMQCGEDINYRNPSKNHNADLHHAVLEGHYDLLEFFIEWGADIAQKNAEGLSAIQIAMQKHNGVMPQEFFKIFARLFFNRDVEGVKSFVNGGFNPNISNEIGDTLPHSFVRYLVNNQFSESEYYDYTLNNFLNQLSEMGFDMNIKNRAGHTADYLIAQSPYDNMLQFIPEERFAALFVEAIGKGDIKIINSLVALAEGRTVGEEAMDRQNVFSKNFDYYLEYANAVNTSEDLKKLLVAKNEELKAKAQLVEPDSSENSVTSEVSKERKSNISRVNSEDLEPDNLPSPPSTTLVGTSSNPIVSKVPSNDNFK